MYLAFEWQRAHVSGMRVAYTGERGSFTWYTRWFEWQLTHVAGLASPRALSWPCTLVRYIWYWSTGRRGLNSCMYLASLWQPAHVFTTWPGLTGEAGSDTATMLCTPWQETHCGPLSLLRRASPCTPAESESATSVSWKSRLNSFDAGAVALAADQRDVRLLDLLAAIARGRAHGRVLVVLRRIAAVAVRAGHAVQVVDVLRVGHGLRRIAVVVAGVALVHGGRLGRRRSDEPGPGQQCEDHARKQRVYPESAHVRPIPVRTMTAKTTKIPT